MILRNVSTLPPHNSVSQPRKQNLDMDNYSICMTTKSTAISHLLLKNLDWHNEMLDTCTYYNLSFSRNMQCIHPCLHWVLLGWTLLLCNGNKIRDEHMCKQYLRHKNIRAYMTYLYTYQSNMQKTGKKSELVQRILKF